MAALQVQRKGLQKSQEIWQHMPFKDEYYKPFKRQMHDEIPQNSHKSWYISWTTQVLPLSKQVKDSIQWNWMYIREYTLYVLCTHIFP